MDICTNEKPIRFNYACKYAPQTIPFSRHMHCEYEMLLFLEGGGCYVIEGRNYPIEPYMLLMVPANTYHFANPKDAPVYCRYMLAFRASVVEGDLLQKIFSAPACYQLEKDSPIVQAFHRLYFFHEAALEGYEDLAMKTLCTEILLGVYAHRRDPGEWGNATEPPKSDPLIAYIEKNITTIQSVEEVAEHFYISPSTLTHRFKNRMGISLMKYIRQKRLLLARSLLEQGEKPLEVCARCGFKEYTTFYKAYVAYFGAAPSKEL